LFPILPLLTQLLHSSWTTVLLAAELCFVGLTFALLFRTRDLEIGDATIAIDAGRQQQVYGHEEIYEIVLLRRGGVALRTTASVRYVQVRAGDHQAAAEDLLAFARRHEIPVQDRRPRPHSRELD